MVSSQRLRQIWLFCRCWRDKPAVLGAPGDELGEVPQARFLAKMVEVGVDRVRREAQGLCGGADGAVVCYGTENQNLLARGGVPVHAKLP